MPTQPYDEYLFSTTTHLLKPITGILGACDTLIQSGADAPAGPQTQLPLEIRGHAHRLLDMVNDLRDYAESQTGRIIIEKEPTDMNELMQGVLDAAPWFVQNKPQLRIQSNIPASLPALTIQAMRIRQVLFNLLHNAVKFSDTGVIEITVEPAEQHLTFIVKDPGIGIAPDQIGLVFAPFQTTLEDKTDPRVGLGLGLCICKYLIEAHQGQLRFESAPGMGSTFHFTLPIA